MNASEILIGQHRDCDARFADAEQAARAQDWPAAEAAFAAMRGEMEDHFRLEEDRLFPAFEQASGMRAGPTAVMRAEHAQMRQLLDGMAQALAARDGDGFLAEADTLLILTQQHNMKEENILYPMCERSVPDLARLLQGAGHAA
ncbi:hemerythrin domain-containing protein [Chromobacterium violaceum]|uniref:Iron-sulfur cluster repair di-iron protein n=1 Tax=Chromobacterium violaceum TaxID=536 RepID=A0AAX2M7E2_CHRVL|nr:hemerythrin domain-containing protein [Chromobacterium violaceum]MBA8736369.1 hemerythrin domain-containing protein [Chromobacterium violaceum]OLZ77140.1 hemerythrin [Chromobacterium violaceum]STB64072.1 iron-sulfur cluster repair di-iron protein [Chromobacterium violaceum]SUX32156.1 iron-sulfur cluster repair di-iron protein [Chromobacterium violaceum]